MPAAKCLSDVGCIRNVDAFADFQAYKTRARALEITLFALMGVEGDGYLQKTLMMGDTFGKVRKHNKSFC